MLDFNARLKRLLDGTIWKSLQASQDQALSEELSSALDELIILAESEHEALESLERQFAIFVKLAEMCPSFLWIADADGSMEYVNERWMEFTGASSEQSMGLGWLNFIDERDRREVLLSWRESVSKTITFEMEFRIVSGLEQKTKWYLARAVPLTDDHGEAVKWFGSCTEINVQKTLKEELSLRVKDLSKLIVENESSRLKLAESETMFRVVCETSPHLIITTGKDGIVDYFNQQWFKYTGEELSKSQSWLDFVHADDRQPLIQKWEEAIKSHAKLEDEVRLKRRDNTYLWHLVRGLPLDDESGKPRRWCISCTDVEAHHSLMRALSKAKESAEETSRFKSSFVANISHELRTPLNGVLGMTQLLRTLDLPEPAADYLNVIEEAGQSLLSVINDVLDFSKIEAGRLELAREDFSVSSLLDGSMNILATQAEFKDLFFISFVDPRIPETVQGDAHRIKQVLLNLLSNAIKFTEIGGVFLSAVLIGRTQDESTIRFSIMDSGIGVSAELQHKLFEPFVQADLSVSRKYGGTGLGLSISQSLVELLGGRLTLVSEPGNGSEFSFTLTFQNAVAQTHIDPSDVMERRFDNRQIIITGRSRHMMERLCQCLSMTGHSIEPVTSLESWCRTVQEKSQSDGEYYLISLGKPPKRWLQNVSLENQKIFKRRIVIADPLTRSGSEEIPAHDVEEMRLSCPVKVSQILAALDGIKTQNISGSQPQINDSSGSIPLTPEQSNSQRNSLGKRNYAKSREFSRTMSSNLTHSDDRKPFRALVADDNAINLRVSKLLLSQFGLEADVAASGFEALEKARLNDYDIIFLDCQMPQMDGFDTCRRIKINQGKQGKWAPVIAVTANSFSVVKESYSRSGMDDFLPKPILSENLFNILAKWLDSDDNSRTIMRQTHRKQNQAERLTAISIPPFESLEDMETTEAEGNSQLRPDLLLSRFGTEHVQLLELFQHSAPENLSQLRQSLDKRDLEDVMKRAHGFKGVCGTICATACEIVLKRLEKEAKSNDYDKVEASITELNENLQGLLMEIHNYLKSKQNKVN